MKNWKKIIDINLTSTFLLSKSAIKKMLKNKFGRIVNVTSIVGHTGNLGQANYAASKAGIIKSVKDLWWDVRPHPGFGTVEIRICDIPINFKTIIALVALIQALVVTLINADPYSGTHIQILQSNKWQAVRYGLEGVFVDPKTFQKLTMRKAIENLCILVEPAIVYLGFQK